MQNIKYASSDVDKEIIFSLFEKSLMHELVKSRIKWANSFPSLEIEIISLPNKKYAIKLNEIIFSTDEEISFVCDDKRVPEMVLEGFSHEKIMHIYRGRIVSKNTGII